ncbi:DUF4097 family beta strand repeat-containing protein [Bacillus sp. 1P06AnD]|uniref:DUF4097 family beta strand repeat-containing protein n=1 Tax=Bacillus sp. 1P06AnD TaxID=3132208 RepID=UPI0039A0692B
MNEEKKRILKLVEEGKITSSEALTLLELLEQEQKQTEHKEKEIMNDVSTFVILDEEEKEDQKAQKKVSSAKDMILDFVDNVFNKVKDLDLNFSKSIEISHIFHQTNTVFNEINIEVANGNMEFIIWDQPDVKVEVEAKVYRTEDMTEARKILLEEISFDIKDGKLYYIVGQKWMRVHTKMFLPKETYEKLKVRLFNGSITGEQLDVKQIKAKTANGKIAFTHLEGEEVDLDTANGNIDIQDFSVDTISCETLNGVIKSSGMFGKAEYETFNGGIFIDHFDEKASYIRAKSTTGSIKIIVPDVVRATGEVRANLGGLNVKMDGMNIVEEKTEVIQKILKFKNNEQATLDIFADSKTGSITLQHG